MMFYNGTAVSTMLYAYENWIITQCTFKYDPDLKFLQCKGSKGCKRTDYEGVKP